MKMGFMLVVDAYKEPKGLVRTCARKGVEVKETSDTNVEEQKILVAIGKYVKENNLGFPLDDDGIPLYYKTKLVSDGKVEIIDERGE